MANTTGQKFGGRTAGTPNKTTAQIREYYQSFIANNLKNMQNDFNELEPKERLKMIIELSKFVVPTLKATELNNITNDFFTPINFNYNE